MQETVNAERDRQTDRQTDTHTHTQRKREREKLELDDILARAKPTNYITSLQFESGTISPPLHQRLA